MLYGTTWAGGISTNGPAYYNGTIFFLTFPLPQLAIAISGTNIALTWPSGVEGAGYDSFMLQSTTNLLPPVIWNTNLPSPVLINNQNIVNLPLPGGQTFYRLAEPPDSPHNAGQ